jgi:AcrR family transcriptional regulator
MARKPNPPPSTAGASGSAGGSQPASSASGDSKSDRERIIAAFVALLAEKRFEQIGFGEIAARAGVSLAELRDAFSSTLAIIAAFLKDIDRAVLAGGEAEMAQEPPRERLFDVMMRRIEALTPYKLAVRSLARSAAFNPGLAFALNGLSVRSQQWMLAGADISASGPKGMIRAQGLQMLFTSVVRTWLDDDDPGLARTMAALDRALASGQRWSGFLDDVFRIPACASRMRPRRRRRDPDEDTIAA